MCGKCKSEISAYESELRKLVLNSHTVDGLKKIGEGINVALHNNSVGVDINRLKDLYAEKLESLKVPAKVTKVESKTICPECNGTGIWKESKVRDCPCFKCHSTGYISDYRLIPTLTVEAMKADTAKDNGGIVVTDSKSGMEINNGSKASVSAAASKASGAAANKAGAKKGSAAASKAVEVTSKKSGKTTGNVAVLAVDDNPFGGPEPITDIAG